MDPKLCANAMHNKLGGHLIISFIKSALTMLLRSHESYIYTNYNIHTKQIQNKTYSDHNLNKSI